MSATYDYVIAGGGTAGCVLAGRLTEDPAVRVLLLEAGGNDRHPFIHVPAGFAKLTASKYDWGFSSVPQKHCNDRVIPLAQGKVIGGGGSINAQVFTRGAHEDYDEWALKYGCAGWSFEEIQKYFLRSEDNERLSAPYHGTDGPLGVSDPVNPHPLSKSFVQAGQEFGLPFNG
ncbi:MAG: alanine-phosphoribitol ligase, partial [Rhodococcus sp. (in: high G+C Gram-positive bacteria)]